MCSSDLFFKAAAAMRSHHDEISAHGLRGLQNAARGRVGLYHALVHLHAGFFKARGHGIDGGIGLSGGGGQVLVLTIGKIRAYASKGGRGQSHRPS